VIPAIETGFFQKEIADASARFQREVDSRDRIIVGVNEYVEDDPVEIPILRMDPQGEKRHLERLRRWKADRDADAWGEAMRRLEEASAAESTNTMPFILDAVNAGATSGEICHLWRRVYGEYKEQVVV
jgi:methylmalonyl-CoA mutase N-terminal domain/subunit